MYSFQMLWYEKNKNEIDLFILEKKITPGCKISGNILVYWDLVCDIVYLGEI